MQVPQERPAQIKEDGKASLWTVIRWELTVKGKFISEHKRISNSKKSRWNIQYMQLSSEQYPAKG